METDCHSSHRGSTWNMRPFIPSRSRVAVHSGHHMAWGVGLIFEAMVLLLGLPERGSAQVCLGLSPEPNSMGIETGIVGQNDGYRFGGWANANVAGRVGVLIGASGGDLDAFSKAGSEVRALLALVVSRTSSNTCLFGEYEGGSERFRDAFGMTRGDYSERWIRFGFALGGNLWSREAIGLTWHAAPEIILRSTRLKGRTTYWEPELYVLETTKGQASSHLGGRVLVVARLARIHLSLSAKNRPRFSSDLQWAIHLGFPL